MKKEESQVIDNKETEKDNNTKDLHRNVEQEENIFIKR